MDKRNCYGNERAGTMDDATDLVCSPPVSTEHPRRIDRSRQIPSKVPSNLLSIRDLQRTSAKHDLTHLRIPHSRCGARAWQPHDRPSFDRYAAGDARLSISCRATALRNVAQGDTRYRPAAKIRQPDRSVSHTYGVSTGPLPLA